MNLDRYCFYVKIFGERNTGTNFVERLIQANFPIYSLQSNNRVYNTLRSFAAHIPQSERREFRAAALDLDSSRGLYSDFGWKHAVPPFQHIAAAPHANNTLFVAVAKHPAAWLQSLMARPYNPAEKTPNVFSDFIRYDWQLSARDNLGPKDRINVVELWNVKNAAYRKLTDVNRRAIVISYEDILRDPESFLKRIEEHIPAEGVFTWQLESTKGDELSFDDYRAKYEIGNVLAKIDPDDLQYVKERADADVMRGFGYAWPN